MLDINNNPRLLIVEDDEFIGKMYEVKFKARDFEVYLTDNGQEALKIAKEKRPDAVLLDINLPTMDGFAILQELKKHSPTEKIPVIMLTNDYRREEIERAKQLGAEDYLIKAHHLPAEVVEKIKRIREQPDGGEKKELIA